MQSATLRAQSATLRMNFLENLHIHLRCASVTRMFRKTKHKYRNVKCGLALHCFGILFTKKICKNGLKDVKILYFLSLLMQGFATPIVL